MKRKILISGIAFLTIVNVVALATMGYHHLVPYKKNDCEKKNGHCSFLRKELDLTKEQTIKINAFKKDFQAKVNPLHKELNTKEGQLVRLLMAENTNRGRIDSVMKEINSTQLRLQQEIVKHLLAEKAIFTEEQQRNFFSIIYEQLTEKKCRHEIDDLSIIDSGQSRSNNCNHGH